MNAISPECIGALDGLFQAGAVLKDTLGMLPDGQALLNDEAFLLSSNQQSNLTYTALNAVDAAIKAVRELDAFQRKQ